MENKMKESYVKATKEGRLYIKTSDFFKQRKIRKTIEILMDSDIIREIDNRRLKES